MSNSIGDLAVTLSLDAIAFVQGLDQSASKASAFTQTVSKAFAGISAGLAIGGEIGGAAKGLYDSFKDGVSEIVRQGQEAHRLGVSLEALAGIQLLAGNDAEKMDHSLMHLSRTLSEAAQGSMEAKGAFQQLHLDASQLAKMPLDASLGKIIDSLNQLGSAADRTNAGMKLFGREGVDILEKLKGGTIGIAEAIAKIKAHGGVGFTERNVANAIDAERSIKEMESTFSRIKLSLVSEFAPVVKNIADWVADIAGPTGGGLRKVFHQAALSLLDGLDSGVDGMEQMVISAHRMRMDFEKIEAIVKSAINPLNLGIGGPGAAKDDFEASVLEEGKKFHDKINAARADLDKMGKPLPPTEKPGGGTELDKFAGPIKALEERLDSQVAAFGLVGEAAERFKLAHDGASDAALKTVDASIKELTTLKDLTGGMTGGLGVMSDMEIATKKIGKAVADGSISLAGFTAGWNKLKETFNERLNADALKVVADSASPLDKFKEHMRDLEEEKKRGLITDAQFNAALGKDSKDLLGSAMMPQKIEHAGAALEGSDQAYESILNFQDAGKQGDVQERTAKAVEEILKQQQAQLRANQQMVDAINRIFKKGT